MSCFCFSCLRIFGVLDLRKDTEVGSVASNFFSLAATKVIKLHNKSCFAKTLSVRVTFPCQLTNTCMYMYLFNIRTKHETHKHHIQLYIDGYSNDIKYVFNDASPT